MNWLGFGGQKTTHKNRITSGHLDLWTGLADKSKGHNTLLIHKLIRMKEQKVNFCVTS